jgi:hypothetical protein
MQTALKFLDEKINFSPVLSVLSASLREIYTGCYWKQQKQLVKTTSSFSPRNRAALLKPGAVAPG